MTEQTPMAQVVQEAQVYDPRYERLETNDMILVKLFQADGNPQAPTDWYVHIVIDYDNEDSGLEAGPFTREEAEVFFHLIKVAGWRTWIEIERPFAYVQTKPYVAPRREQILYSCKDCGYLITKPGYCGKHF